MPFRSICLVVQFFLFFLLSIPAQAQMAAITGGSEKTETVQIDPATMTPDAINEMVARMSDDQVRSLLLDRLDAVAKENAQTNTANEGAIATISRLWSGLTASLSHVVLQLPNLFSNQMEAISIFSNSFESGGLLKLFGIIAGILALGYAAERAVGVMTRRWHQNIEPTGDGDLKGALRFLWRRFCHELLGLVVFYIVVMTLGRTLLDENQLAFAGPFVIYLVWVPRLGAAISRFVLAPSKPALRMVNVNDHWASYLYRNLIGLFLLIGATLFIVGFNTRTGIDMSETRLAFWLNTAVHIYIVVIAWTAREGLVEMMRGADPDRSRYDEMVATAYPYFAIAVSVVMWLVVETIIGTRDPKLVSVLRSGPHFVTMFWLLMMPAIDTLIRGLVRHLLPPMSGDGRIAEEAYRSTKRSYIRIGRVIAVAFVIVMIANAWRFNLGDLLANRGGGSIAGNLIEFVLVAAVGYIIYEVVSLWINRRLAKEQTTTASTEEEMGGGEGGGAGGSRLATVLPLVRISSQIAIGIIFTLLALGSLGIDTTPLLAGAGILGLAIGFGAQKLVSDIVSGVFFLIDDAFRVGEYVDVGGTMGTVEKISIRSMQLRHHRGNVHTIPYGSVEKVTNFSRDWVIMKLMFTVPFDTDPNKVKKIFKKIGAEMLEDPVFGNDFLEPFKSQGVLQFDDVGIVMRGKFMAKPGTQFTIRKEIYNRVRNEFAAAGIEFARREVRVAIPGIEHAEDLSEQEKTAVGAAATGVVQAEIDKQSGQGKS